ncbi:MAG: 50S ribosomal protein L9 [Xanthomonadales bacterium]|jgi:large subunit ribosomal protein L9|nr:50S ribosomal protein L9 [Xanthomonadales bacterium]
MDVILVEKVKGLGILGDRVKVKPGYARNFLVPYGKAVPATEANVAEFAKRRADYEARAAQLIAAAEARKSLLEGATIMLRANASMEGKLYGSVGAREIAEAMTASGMPVDKGELVMPDGPLRRTGEFEIPLALHADVQTAIKVIVEAEV